MVDTPDTSIIEVKSEQLEKFREQASRNDQGISACSIAREGVPYNIRYIETTDGDKFCCCARGQTVTLCHQDVEPNKKWSLIRNKGSLDLLFEP